MINNDREWEIYDIKWDYIINLFQSIQLGEKVFEVRLYDKKRQLIKHGDEIVFTNLTTAETMLS